jgi:hypothetical protein
MFFCRFLVKKFEVKFYIFEIFFNVVIFEVRHYILLFCLLLLFYLFKLFQEKVDLLLVEAFSLN